jgi:hypothetical protein
LGTEGERCDVRIGVDEEGCLRHPYHGPPLDRAHYISGPAADPLTLGALDPRMWSTSAPLRREVAVTVQRTFEDGTSITRDAFSYEREGEHKHRFTQEERRTSYA